jgi:hypothetical protein
MEEFTNSTGWKIFYSAIAAAMVIFSLFLFSMDHTKAGSWVLIIPFILLLFALLIIAVQIKRKIIISADSIIKIGVFGQKELVTANVKGCRISEKVICIEPVSLSYQKITINNFSDLGNSDDLVKWLKENFKDLDAEELIVEQNKILQDTDLGFTEQEREEKLAKAKQIAIGYNIIGVIVGVTAFFLNNSKIIVIVALLYPLLGIVIMKFSDGLIKFVSNRKRSVYPFIVIGFYLPVLLVFVASIMPYDIFKYEHIWPITIIITLTVFTLSYTTGINRTAGSIKGQVIFMVILAALYGYGSTIQLNCLFDPSKPQQFQATVLGHHITTGKSNTYFLTLSPWGPEKETKEVSVGKWLYNEVAIGGTVKVNFKNGLLNIPWFTVTD